MTWVYLIGGQLRTFTFLGSQALGSDSPSTLIVSSPPNLDVLQQLSALSASYARLAGVTQWDAASAAQYSDDLLARLPRRGLAAA